MKSRGMERASADVDLVRRIHGCSVIEARNTLAKWLSQAEWFKGLEGDDDARAVFRELNEIQYESALTILWWAMRHFAAEDGVEIVLSHKPFGPIVLEERGMT
jgi:hypothetical protein